ncbi:Autophagy-related protein 11 [Erysiphe neolycopersici]|uniref:Autophagy-related protein 11 n=1 Tax=Erysiphe neolycopersici TaxID=212602 RepID=A0A420HLH2_9PEZI|nr:Autophagy-related protein 11 [Erysiphe neolycopersici]
MALKVFIAHSGQCLLADSEDLRSIEVFKAWVSKNSKVVAQDQIHLNADGKHVKFAGLGCETEIFVYDWHLVQSHSPWSVKFQQYDIPIPQSYHVSKPPDTISDQNQLEAWRDLFKARQSWSLGVLSDCQRMSNDAQKRLAEIEVIIRAASTAVRNVQKHVSVVDQKNSVIQGWVEDIRKIQESSGTDWIRLLDLLRAVPVKQEIVLFISGHEPQGNKSTSLEDLIHNEKFKRARNLVGGIQRQLFRSIVELEKKIDEIFRNSDVLINIVSKNMPERSQATASLDPVQLLQEIKALSKKISIDCENVQSRDSVNLPQASKLALVHTKMLLPNMVKRSMEMSSLVQNVTKIRNSLAVSSLETMQQISCLTLIVSEVTSRLSDLEPSEEANEALQTLLNITILPVTYASFLAEGIRRKQWKEKIEIDSSTLINEFKKFQEEEVRRRRKWQKAIGVTLLGKRVEQNVPELELNIQGIDDNWPKILKQDLEEVFEILQSKDPNSALAKEVSKILSDLCNPTKQQTKRAKAAFKAGSIHENILGRSALLVRGDDELIRILQEEGQKTESKLRTAESRVRRLENLLHQHTQVHRSTFGNKFQSPCRPSIDFQDPNNQAQSPRPLEDQSQPLSISPRRTSINQIPVEKSAYQKIFSLEAELISEKERSSKLENEIKERKLNEEKLKFQIEEANSTKRDLLKNLEAQQREFIAERKSLATEIKRVQAQKEDLEIDLEQIVISRGNEKDNYDENESSSLIKSRPETSDVALNNSGNFISDDIEHEQISIKSSELQKLREEKEKLIFRTNEAEKAVAEHLEILRNVHRKILPLEEVPESFDQIAQSLTRKPSELILELELLKKDLQFTKSNSDKTQNTLDELRSELSHAQEKLQAEEFNSSKSQEALKEQYTKLATLDRELADNRLQLTSARENIIELEKNLENLQKRLLEEEDRFNSLKDSQVAQISDFECLKKETEAYRNKNELIQAQYDKLTSRIEDRTSRAMDLTRRFSTQTDQLCKLLERLSYSITRGARSMIIQRLPKVERPNPNEPSESNSTVRRSLPINSIRKPSIESEKLESLNWVHNDDIEIERQKYDSYLDTAGYFDIEAFCETISKRVKDLEYTAKKYSRDARLYREKFHSAQKEAHGKIAFKNFKEGDLALFLPTRNQATGAWAAFNIGAPHYFLKEQDFHKLRSRDWLLARIHKIEDRVVDLSKSLPGSHMHISHQKSCTEISNDGDSLEDDNPFDLSDGLRWYLIEAAEEKPGAPTTPGLGKCTVASANIDATGSIRRSKKTSNSNMEGINRTLSKNLHTRRDSNNSKKSLASASSFVKANSTSTDTTSLKSATKTQTVEEGTDNIKIRSDHKLEEIKCRPESMDKGSTSENFQKPATESTMTNLSRRSIIWDSLWSLDLSIESGKSKK